MLDNISSVGQRLGYTFKNQDLLVRALTHKTFAQEQKQRGRNCEDQELYRIYGDAVLKLILVEMLIDEGKNSRGSITEEKSKLENRKNLAQMFEKMGITQFIRFGKGEEKQNISKQSSVLGETFEALIAAIRLDSGNYEITKEVVINLFKETKQTVVGHSNHQVSNQDSEFDEIGNIWIHFNVCNTCVNSDICAIIKMCYLDVNRAVPSRRL